jgi:hypothetical protein
MAGTVIITKYSLATGSPATNDLAVGEQAYSFVAGEPVAKLYLVIITVPAILSPN